MDFRDRPHGAPRVSGAGPLVDAQRRLQSLDQVNVGPFQLVQELPGVDRQALDVLPLAFGVQRVECQTALARTAGPRDHDQPVARNVQVHVLQVMHSGAANTDHFGNRIRSGVC